jgi:CHAT domain-containing protein
LAAGARVAREIGGEETHEHRIELPAASYARVTVEQAAIDVALELRGPDGAVLARVDSPGGHRVPELLSWIAPAAGAYRLLVRAHDPQTPRGSYAVTLEEVRPAVPGDEARVATERAAADARQRSFSERVEDKRKALEDLQRVLAAWQTAGDRTEEARTLNDLADLQLRLGDPPAARALLAEVLQIGGDLDGGGPRGRERARALNQLGMVEGNREGGKIRALELYNRALALCREIGDRACEAEALYSLGVLRADEGDSAAALDSYEQARALQEAGGMPAEQAFTLAAIGLIKRDRGDAAGALACFSRGLELARLSGDRSAEAYLLYSTGSFQLRRGELQRSVELFTSALEQYRRQGDLPRVTRVLSSLCTADLYLGDLDRALGHCQEAQAQYDTAPDPAEVYNLLSLGSVLQLQGNTESAIDRFRQALDIGIANGRIPDQAAALHFLGRASLALGRTAEAARFLEQALALHEKTGRASERARTLIELGRAHKAMGDGARATRELQEALTLGRGLQNFLVEVAAQGELARLERDRGDLPAARAAIEEALRILDSLRSKVASQRLRVSFVASRQPYYDLHLDILMRLFENDPAGGDLAAALTASERARARGLLDLLAEGRIDVRRGIAPDLKQREEEIDNRISVFQTQMLENLSAGAWDAAKAARLELEIRQADEDRERLEWEIRRRNPRYAAVRYPEPLRLAEIQGLLDDRTAFLEYAVGEERSFLFVVTREGLTSYVLPSAAHLADEVRRLREILATPGRRGYGPYVGLARTLYRELITPAAGVVAGKPHLVLAPDGPLHFLSFEALLTQDPGNAQDFAGLPYLLRDKSVTYVPSASVLAELTRPREREETAASPVRFVGFGDPVPAVAPAATASLARAARDGSLASALPQLGRLSHSRREIQGIAGLYGPGEARVYLDGEATEENVKDNKLLRSVRRIHFATHGLLDERQPELSGLVLTRSPGSREDGLLQVYEIFNLQLSADLVVLSACDTGLGTMVSGEGLVGVTRALLYAGAQSVVVSLWNVNDASTPNLMISFYHHLDQGAGEAEALRLAKLEMIRQPGLAHPFYWAPFILIGEPR